MLLGLFDKLLGQTECGRCRCRKLGGKDLSVVENKKWPIGKEVSETCRYDSTDSDGWFCIDLKEIPPERSEEFALQNLRTVIIKSKWMVK